MRSSTSISPLLSAFSTSRSLEAIKEGCKTARRSLLMTFSAVPPLRCAGRLPHEQCEDGMPVLSNGALCIKTLERASRIVVNLIVDLPLQRGKLQGLHSHLQSTSASTNKTLNQLAVLLGRVTIGLPSLSFIVFSRRRSTDSRITWTTSRALRSRARNGTARSSEFRSRSCLGYVLMNLYHT
jgi:hypothetical protein